MITTIDWDEYSYFTNGSLLTLTLNFKADEFVGIETFNRDYYYAYNSTIK